VSRRLAAAAAWLLLSVAVPSPVAADTTFGQPTVSSEFGVSIEFAQPATITESPKRAELLLELPGAVGPHVIEVPVAGAGAITLRHELLIAEGHLLPNTPLTAQWRITDPDGTVTLGPPVTTRYEDDRVDWQTRQGDVVRVHWSDGSAAFGERALQIGERAVAETAELLGVTEEEPIDFFVYADQASFLDALGPATRENVGGQANAEIRTLFALIPPGEIDDPWVDIVIPHELVHLVFDTAVDNPYHFPPRWLNEGLAVYLSQGNAIDDRLRVEGAARDGSLIPLDGLTAQFPTTFERFTLAYAESVSAVDYLVRAHGRDALVGLIRSYADGVTDDEAFRAALGIDVAGFDAAWREDLGAVEPEVHGPQPAPPGPLPPGWLGEGGSPAPPLAPGAPTTRPGASPMPPVIVDPGDPGTRGAITLVAGLIVALAAAAAFVVWRIRRRSAARRQAWSSVDGDGDGVDKPRGPAS
jgi:hypothetical protein